jgi:hypothetical protein
MTIAEEVRVFDFKDGLCYGSVPVIDAPVAIVVKEEPLIEVDLTGFNGTHEGFIVEWPSGVRFSNVTDGHCTAVRMLTGVFVPFWLPDELLTEIEGENITTEMADRFDRYFARKECPVYVDRSSLDGICSFEAWVCCYVKDEDNLPPGWAPFRGRRAVAVWKNSV